MAGSTSAPSSSPEVRGSADRARRAARINTTARGGRAARGRPDVRAVIKLREPDALARPRGGRAARAPADKSLNLTPAR